MRFSISPRAQQRVSYTAGAGHGSAGSEVTTTRRFCLQPLIHSLRQKPESPRTRILASGLAARICSTMRCNAGKPSEEASRFAVRRRAHKIWAPQKMHSGRQP